MMSMLKFTQRRRGSALILVVAMLAVLAIFTLTLGFNTRMELTASRNWGNAVQARMAAQTGVALFQNGNTGINTPFVARLAETAESDLRPVTLRLQLADVEAALAAAEAEAKAAGVQSKSAGRATDKRRRNADDSKNGEVEEPASGPATLAKSHLQDTSAKININSLVPVRERPRAQPVSSNAENFNRAQSASYASEEILGRLIQNVLAARGINDVDGAALAHAIAMRRYGADQRAGAGGIDDNLNGNAAESIENSLGYGNATLRRSLPQRIDRDGLDNNLNGQADESAEAIDEPAESAADPRLAPAGDDRPYISIGELLAVQGMTPQIYEAIAPYVTVFSASHAAFDMSGTTRNSEENQGFPQVDPNTATPEEIFDVLRARFPAAPKALLAQYAVNMLDRRDADRVPSEWAYEQTTYYGLEMSPLIYEVCSDVASLDDEGDDGQYIELYNPYDVAMDLSGWTLSGAGPSIRLSNSIPAGGILVITDDFNDQNDANPEDDQPSMGSFYKLFNRVSNGGSRHLIEHSTMNIPNESGSIELRDREGNLIDVFNYSGGTWKGSPKSFQREDPRVRVAKLARATPLDSNDGSVSDSRQVQFALKVQQQWQDKPFADALDAMLVSSAFGVAGGNATDPLETQPWALPELAAGSNQLDVRLVDCFRVGARIPDRDSSTVVNSADARENMQRLREAAMDRQNSRESAKGAKPFRAPEVNSDVVFGRININTAAPIVLSTLPGMTPQLLNRIVGARVSRTSGTTVDVQLSPAEPGWWAEADPLGTPVWRNFSDFLTDETVWQNRPLYDRLDAAYPFLGLVTTHSVSMRALTGNRPDNMEEDENRRPSSLMFERIVTADRGAVETVRFAFHQRVTAQTGDSDLRSAAPIADPERMMTLAGLSAAYGAADADEPDGKKFDSEEDDRKPGKSAPRRNR